MDTRVQMSFDAHPLKKSQDGYVCRRLWEVYVRIYLSPHPEGRRGTTDDLTTSCLRISLPSTVQFSSVQDGIYALGIAHVRSTPSLNSFPNVAFETVPMLVCLRVALSRPLKDDR